MCLFHMLFFTYSYSLLMLAIKNGNRDLSLSGVEQTHETVAGASARYVAESQLTDEVKHQAGIDFGKPTDRFSDREPVTDFQSLPVDERYYDGGHDKRFYANKLGTNEGRTGSSQLRGEGRKSNATSKHKQTAAATAVGLPPSSSTAQPRLPQSSSTASTALSHTHPHPARHTGMYYTPPPQPMQQPVQMKDHDDGFKRRLTNQYMTDGKNDPNSLRRKNRIINDLSSNENNATKTMAQSYVRGNSSPAQGVSQDAAAMIMAMNQTPQKQNDNPSLQSSTQKEQDNNSE